MESAPAEFRAPARMSDIVGGALVSQAVSQLFLQRYGPSGICALVAFGLLMPPRAHPAFRWLAENYWDGFQWIGAWGLVLIGAVLFALTIFYTPLPTTSAYVWQPLTHAQRSKILSQSQNLPDLTFVIFRPTTPDCEALSDDLAGVLKQSFTMLALPSSPGGLSTFGLTIFVRHHEHPVKSIEDLRRILSTALDYSVDIQELNPNAYESTGIPDFALAIGTKKKPEFFVSGSQIVPPRKTTVRINARAPKGYRVSVGMTWNATAKVTDRTADHFDVTFSVPAPSSDAIVYWNIYRY